MALNPTCLFNVQSEFESEILLKSFPRKHKRQPYTVCSFLKTRILPFSIWVSLYLQPPFPKIVSCCIDAFCKILRINFTIDVRKYFNPFLRLLKILGVQELTFCSTEKKIDQFHQSSPMLVQAGSYRTSNCFFSSSA